MVNFSSINLEWTNIQTGTIESLVTRDYAPSKAVFFKKMGHPRPLFCLFLSFQANITILKNKFMWKMSLSQRCWDSNPQPSGNESPPVKKSELNAVDKNLKFLSIYILPFSSSKMTKRSHFLDKGLTLPPWKPGWSFLSGSWGPASWSRRLPGSSNGWGRRRPTRRSSSSRSWWRSCSEKLYHEEKMSLIVFFSFVVHSPLTTSHSTFPCPIHRTIRCCDTSIVNSGPRVNNYLKSTDYGILRI